MRIQVLYFEGCPNGERTIDLVAQIARNEGLNTAIERTKVQSIEEAIRLRFLGSPTVRINGADVDAAARGRTDFAMVCRVYGATGVPPAETIAAAIRDAAAGA